MSDIADDEPDATIVTDFAYDRINTEQKFWKFCLDATVPRSEVVFDYTGYIDTRFFTV